MYTVMLYKCVFYFFMICNSIFCSNGACFPDSKDWSSGIPKECSDCDDTFSTPTNHICSISYLLFNEDNIDSPCYVEPKNQDFNRCEFDPNKQTKILIHGFTVQLKSGNVFELIKDEILTVENANVIIVNWTRYDNFLYERSVEYAYTTGIEVGKFIKFLVYEKGMDPGNVHIIGHSLGAHVAGVAGKHVPGLARISGLDPAAPSYSLNVTYNRLTASDANFVDVIHCSNGVDYFGTIGFGIPQPIGDVNFYPNGGVYQPACKLLGSYKDSDGETTLIKTSINLKSCRHDMCNFYFLYSIRECKFLSRQCNSYKRYNKGSCFSNEHPEDLMGYYAMKIPGLQPHSMFYLNTTSKPPFCRKNCN